VQSVGVAKARLPLVPLVMLGLLAGAFIGLGSLYYVTVVGDPGLTVALQRVLGGLAFSLGLLLVVVAGAELFTGNNLIAMAWADGKVSSRELVVNCLVVCTANFAGAVGLAVLVLLSGHAEQYSAIYLRILEVKTSLPANKAFFSGVLCNVLVCCGREVGGRAVQLGAAERGRREDVLLVDRPGRLEGTMRDSISPGLAAQSFLTKRISVGSSGIAAASKPRPRTNFSMS
jgi:hypothetical protein